MTKTNDNDKLISLDILKRFTPYACERIIEIGTINNSIPASSVYGKYKSAFASNNDIIFALCNSGLLSDNKLCDFNVHCVREWINLSRDVDIISFIAVNTVELFNNGLASASDVERVSWKIVTDDSIEKKNRPALLCCSMWPHDISFPHNTKMCITTTAVFVEVAKEFPLLSDKLVKNLIHKIDND